MESTRETTRKLTPERRFRDQSEERGDTFVEVALKMDGPLEINMTDEPGGDPYNHTGRFKRLYR